MNIDEEEAHSEMGPSTAHRWRACPGSVAKSRGIPNIAGKDAADGTVFHYYAALCLELGLDPQLFVGERMNVDQFHGIEFDQKMADSMLDGLNLLWSLAEAPRAEMIVEKRVSIEPWVGKGQFGTTDCAIIDVLNWRLIVFDWKYGAGVPVGPYRNDQAILYTLGVWHDYAAAAFEQFVLDQGGNTNDPWEEDIEVVVMIEQPRAPGGGGTWTTTMGEILQIGEQIKADAEVARKPNAPFHPGEKQCKFCPAARVNTCEHRARAVIKELMADYDDLAEDFAVNAPMELPDPKALTPEQRSQILLHKPFIEKFLEQIHQEAYADALAARPTPGLKLVAGRSPPRGWKDEKRAELMLRRRVGAMDAFKRTLLSPTAAEELMGKRDFALHFGRMVEKGEAKSILVPDTDKRPRVPNAKDDFSDDDVMV